MTLVNPLDLQEVVQPRTLAEALLHLQRSDVTVYPLAGGTRLLNDTAAGVRAVLDLSLLGWRYVEEQEAVLRIGATTPLADIRTHTLLAAWAGGLLSRAAALAAPSVLRHQHTVGGAVAVADPADDLLVALLALDATVQYYTPDRRDVPHRQPLAAFLANRPDGPFLIEAVDIPKETRSWRTAFHRVGRTPRDRALVNVAVAVRPEGERWTHVRVAVGGVAATPIRLEAVERLLEGQTPSPERLVEVERTAREAVHPPDDWRASAAYRRALTGILVRRACAELSRMFDGG